MGKCAAAGTLGGLLGGNAKESKAKCLAACEQERL